jgi:hypothetical protein
MTDKVQEIMALVDKYHAATTQTFREGADETDDANLNRAYRVIESRLREVVAPPVPEPSVGTEDARRLAELLECGMGCGPTERKAAAMLRALAAERDAQPGVLDREALARAMADKLMAWKLPQNFGPDCFITFDRELAAKNPHCWPVGTNLFTHKQAVEMLLEIMPAAPTEATTPQPASEPVVWVNPANLASAKVSQERGGPYDQHTWSEQKTDYHCVPLYATPQPAAKPVDKAELKRLVSLVFGDEFQIVRQEAKLAQNFIIDMEEGGQLAVSVPKPAQAEPVARDGWVMVPVEPTEAMISAGFKHVYHPTMENDMEHVWSAMLAASPTQPRPQPRPQPLTDEQIMGIAKNPMTAPCSPWWLKDDVVLNDVQNAAKLFTRAIEQAHGITAQEPTE